MTTETSLTDLINSTGKLTDEVVKKFILLEQRLQTAITDFECRTPVGMPMPWPSATLPDGWLSCNGAPFDKLKYPQLAELYPGGYTPDLRGEFIRGWDDRSNRVILSQQKGSLVGYETGATIPDGVWSISVKNSPTIQHSQEVLGLDSYDSNIRRIFRINQLITIEKMTYF
ncbi:MAG: phage tail protein [Enterobacteriaceae bacterium]